LGQSEGDPASGKESDGEVATSEIVAIWLVRRSVLIHHGLERVSESDTTLGRDVLVNKTNCFDLKDSVELVNDERKLSPVFGVLPACKSGGLRRGVSTTSRSSARITPGQTRKHGSKNRKNSGKQGKTFKKTELNDNNFK
jgi:hypothetical protein